MHKRTFSLLFLFLPVLAATALASDVPALTAGELADIPAAAVSAINAAEAHPIWLILAGEGFWGAIVIGIAGFLYRLVRPYILAWMEERRLTKVYLAAEACVAKNNVDYVEAMKRAHADGKLTKDEAEAVFGICKRNLVDFMQSQGVDIIKEYGDLFVDALIELMVSRMKNPLAKAVAAPLGTSSDSPPLPPSVTGGMMPA